MIWVLTTALMIMLLTEATQLILFVCNFKEYTPAANSYLPNVSILVAAKDEEANINRCLDSLSKLSYPPEKLEILIGNDASEDNTFSISQKYAQRYAYISVFDITDAVAKLKGKANVLAQLAHQATGEYFLITDADMKLPKHWVQNMVAAMKIKQKTGLAIGVTHVAGNRMQDMDWLYGLAMVKVVTDLDLPVTGMGNNMIISKEAYCSVGGYESLPFSVTEDLELFRHVRARRYGCLQVFEKEVLGTTLPMKGFMNLLNQRKRWMRGAVQLPWQMIGLLSLQPVFYLVLAGLFFCSPAASGLFFAGKVFLRLVFMTMIRKRLQLPFRGIWVLIYEFYSFFTTISSMLYFLLPVKVRWKGRTY